MNEVLKQIISHIELPEDQLKDQDPEIREIFIEEVQEIIEFLHENLPQWLENPAQKDLLADIRRSFHTLKGSGRMAGAFTSAEVAWAIEESLNRVVAGNAVLSPDLQHLVYSVATLYNVLVKDFENGAVHQIELRPWIATAQRLRDEQDVEPELRYTIDYYRDLAIPDLSVTAQTTGDELVAVEQISITTAELKINSQDVDHSEIDAQAEPEVSLTLNSVELTVAEPVHATEHHESLESQTLEIFLEESTEHLQTIADFLHLQQEPEVDDFNQLIRAVHTIRGSSGMVGFDAIFSASSNVENVYKHLEQDNYIEHTAERQLLLDYYEYVNAYVTALGRKQAGVDLRVLNDQFDAVWQAYEAQGTSINSGSNTQGLVADLLDLDVNELLDAEFSFVDELQNNPDGYVEILKNQAQTLIEHTQSKQTDALHKIAEFLLRTYQALSNNADAVKDALLVDKIQKLHQYLIDAFDGLASGQNIIVTHLIEEEFEQIIIDVETATPALVEFSLAEPTESETTHINVDFSAQEANIPQEANRNFDPDLLEIFLEESDELVVGMDEDFNTWEQDPHNTHVLKNLFRYLHTLKGGANMVQATHLGHIAHELESIYERVLKGMIVPDSATMSVIRYAQDDIAVRLQRLRDHSIDEDNPTLVAQLRAIATGAGAVQSDNLDVPASVVEDILAELEHASTPQAASITALPVVDESLEIQPANHNFDPDLLEIFLEESDELVAGMDEDFNIWEKEPHNTHVLKNLFRYLHTLKGGANMVQATHLGNIAHELESIYERVLKGSITPDLLTTQMIRYAQDDIAVRLQRLRDYSIDEDNPSLIAQLRAIATGGLLRSAEETAIDATTAESIELLTDEQQADTVAEDKLPQDESIANDLSLDADSHLVEQEDAYGALESADQPEIQANATLDADVAARTDEKAQLSNANDYPALLAKAIDSGDEEKIVIVESYLEEASELLDEAESLFQQWRTDRNNRSTLLTLQRAYHTIKGNSRLINEQLIGFMAYQLELVFEQYALHQFTSDRYDSLIRHAQKWLRDAIYLNKFDGAEPLKARLQAMSYQESLVPEESSASAGSIDFAVFEDVQFVQGDGSTPPDMYAQVETKQEQQAQELIRISADLVEKMIDLSGESAINRSRIELDLGQMTNTLTEMELAIQRLADQLRRMEGELETQIMAKHEVEGQRYTDFDPLEMDQYSSLNQLSKSLAESASDLIDFKTTLAEKIRDTESLLLQQSRLQTELQQSLMGTRLVPFARLVPRLQRLVRQTSTQLNRPVDFNIENTEGELDRNILERLVSPLEHMLRNAIDHGIEDQDARAHAGKKATGRINLNIAREGNDILVIFSDDGRGINVDAVKSKAQQNGLITPDMQVSDVDVMQYIFHPGLSTAQKVTQISGRGVGLDVVQNEIKSLGGHVSVNSELGKGTEFTIRVPTSVAVSDALMVRVGDQQFALPLAQIERIVRVSPVALSEYYDSRKDQFELDQQKYRLRYVGEFVTGQAKPVLSNMGSSVPVIIFNSGGRSVALQVDQLIGSRAQIVIKPIGKQLSSVGYVGGATILADGRVCLILDGQAIARRVLTTARSYQIEHMVQQTTELRATRKTVLVVDDSVTVRKVTSRLLERHGFDVVTAKDGVDAIEKLAQITPDLMLLDIEMPRMDGFEVANYVRHDSHHKQLPIIMITSRTGEKHRERAFTLGVNEYMGKPFQEADLVENIAKVLETTVTSS